MTTPITSNQSGAVATETAVLLIFLLVTTLGIVDFSALTWSRHQLSSVTEDAGRLASFIEDGTESSTAAITALQGELNASLSQLPFLSDASAQISPSLVNLPGTGSQQWRKVDVTARHRFYFLRLIGLPDIDIQRSSFYRFELQPDIVSSTVEP